MDVDPFACNALPSALAAAGEARVGVRAFYQVRNYYVDLIGAGAGAGAYTEPQRCALSALLRRYVSHAHYRESWVDGAIKNVISRQIVRGGRLLLYGPRGAGKSTVLAECCSRLPNCVVVSVSCSQLRNASFRGAFTHISQLVRPGAGSDLWVLAVHDGQYMDDSLMSMIDPMVGGNCVFVLLVDSVVPNADVALFKSIPVRLFVGCPPAASAMRILRDSLLPMAIPPPANIEYVATGLTVGVLNEVGRSVAAAAGVRGFVSDDERVSYVLQCLLDAQEPDISQFSVYA